MKKEVWIGKKGFSYWYYQFRDSEYYSFTLIGLTILVCVALIFFVVIPEFTNWFSIRNEVVATRERIKQLNDSLTFVNSLNKTELDSQVQTATTALPVDKDFNAALDTIAAAAIATGVSLNDFSFQVGAVTTSPKHEGSVSASQAINPMRITMVLSGSVTAVKQFINAIERSLPLAEVTDIDGTDQSVSLTVQFYQKDFPDIKINDKQPLSSLPAEKLAILQKLQTMKRPSSLDFRPASPSSSSGALPLF